MEPEIRKIVSFTETLLAEGGRPLDRPIRYVAVGAVIRNPLVGQPFVDDLAEFVDAFGPPLGELLGPKVVELLDGRVEAYGKGALVGEDGEIEHGSAIIHTLKFGDRFRGPAKGTTLLPAAEKRGGIGAPLDLALKHKDDHAIRSHHLTFEVRVADAPRRDEIVIYCTAADGGRPHARIGAGPQDDS